MASLPGRLLALALACAVLGAAAGPGLGGAAVSGDAPPSVGQQATPTNGTVRHVDPDTVDEPGDLAALEGWLGDRMGDRLDSSTSSISQEEYEAARAVLGDRYGALLERYGDVVEATAAEGDDAAAASFRNARNDTRSFAERRERFEETYQSYRDARQRGDDGRARELARELIATARAVEEDGDRLDRDLADVENATGRDLGAIRQRVRDITLNTTERADLVGGETFVGTRLTATVSQGTVSFLEPAVVRGRLVDENGTGLAGQTVRIAAGGEDGQVTATTNASGWYAATLRPVRQPVGPATLSVGYRPPPDSDYLGNRTTVPVTVEPVTPAMTVTTSHASVAFGDRLRVTGVVRANGTPLPGVPMVVSVAGVRLGSATTDASGRYGVAGQFPASVPAGEQAVNARVNLTGRAVASSATRAPLVVESTATTVTVDGTADAGRRITLQGRLATATGLGVPDQPVQLLVDGERRATARTGPDGRYATDVSFEEGAVPADRNLTVRASFEGGGTNLVGASADDSVLLPQSPDGSANAVPVRASAESSIWGWLVGLLAVGLAMAGVALPLRRLRTETGAEPTEPDDDGEAASAETDGPSPATPDWRDDVAALIEAGETDRAVATAYGVARGRLAPALGLGGSLTHWEFYAACASDGLGDERVAALESLTEAYEAARFAPSATSREEATSAIENAGAALAG